MAAGSAVLSALTTLGDSIRSELGNQNARIDDLMARKDAAEAAQKTAEDELRAKRSLFDAVGIDFDSLDQALLKKFKDAFDQFEAVGGDAGLAAAAPHRPRVLSAQEKLIEAYLAMLTAANLVPGALYDVKWEGAMHSMVRVVGLPYDTTPNMVHCEIVVVLGSKSNFIAVGVAMAKARFTLVDAGNADSMIERICLAANLDKIWESDKATYASDRFRSDLTLMYNKESYCSKVRTDTLKAVQAFLGDNSVATAAGRNGKQRMAASVSKGAYRELTNAQIALRAGRDDRLAAQRAASAGTTGTAAAANLFMGVMNSGRVDGGGTSAGAGGSADPLAAPAPAPEPEPDEEEGEEVEFVGATTAEQRNAAGFAAAIDLTNED